MLIYFMRGGANIVGQARSEYRDTMAKDNPNEVIQITSASSLSEEDIAHRKTLGEAEGLEHAKPDAIKPAQSTELLEVDRLLKLADGLLYSTEKCCEEYLPNRPPHLVTAMGELREAVEKREPWPLQMALRRLEKITHDIFASNGPDGPIAT